MLTILPSSCLHCHEHHHNFHLYFISCLFQHWCSCLALPLPAVYKMCQPSSSSSSGSRSRIFLFVYLRWQTPYFGCIFLYWLLLRLESKIAQPIIVAHTHKQDDQMDLSAFAWFARFVKHFQFKLQLIWRVWCWSNWSNLCSHPGKL